MCDLNLRVRDSAKSEREEKEGERERERERAGRDVRLLPSSFCLSLSLSLSQHSMSPLSLTVLIATLSPVFSLLVFAVDELFRCFASLCGGEFLCCVSSFYHRNHTCAHTTHTYRNTAFPS
jgi:hypothetical protein